MKISNSENWPFRTNRRFKDIKTKVLNTFQQSKSPEKVGITERQHQCDRMQTAKLQIWSRALFRITQWKLAISGQTRVQGYEVEGAEHVSGLEIPRSGHVHSALTHLRARALCAPDLVSRHPEDLNCRKLIPRSHFRGFSMVLNASGMSERSGKAV